MICISQRRRFGNQRGFSLTSGIGAGSFLERLPTPPTGWVHQYTPVGGDNFSVIGTSATDSTTVIYP